MTAAIRCGSLGSSQNGEFEQRRHRGEETLPGEVEPVGEPAIADQKADEVLCRRAMAAALEHDARVNPE